MSDELTDAQVSLLCDIGERDPSKLSDPDRDDLARLRNGGFVEEAPDGTGLKLRLTAKAQQWLGERGAGLNEG